MGHADLKTTERYLHARTAATGVHPAAAMSERWSRTVRDPGGREVVVDGSG